MQQARKTAGLQKQDSIHLVIAAENALADMLSSWKDAIREKVGAEKIDISSTKPSREYQHSSEEKVKGKAFTIFFDKL